MTAYFQIFAYVTFVIMITFLPHSLVYSSNFCTFDTTDCYLALLVQFLLQLYREVKINILTA
jgi:hypothetical protein